MKSMKTKREFEIAWQGLKPGIHEYTYNIDQTFFEEEVQGQELGFSEAQISVRLSFDKETNFFMLHFAITGQATVPCDRCGENFSMQLWDEFDLMLKLSDLEKGAMEEQNADVIFISRQETVIDIKPWIYEYILLSIPLQKVHPNNTEGQPTCDPKTLALLNKMNEAAEAQHQSNIWKGLENIKIQSDSKKNKRNKLK